MFLLCAYKGFSPLAGNQPIRFRPRRWRLSIPSLICQRSPPTLSSSLDAQGNLARQCIHWGQWSSLLLRKSVFGNAATSPAQSVPLKTKSNPKGKLIATKKQIIHIQLFMLRHRKPFQDKCMSIVQFPVVVFTDIILLALIGSVPKSGSPIRTITKRDVRVVSAVVWCGSAARGTR